MRAGGIYVSNGNGRGRGNGIWPDPAVYFEEAEA